MGKITNVIAGAAAAAFVAVAPAKSGAEVETPAYERLVAQGDFELRRYPALVVARVDRAGSRGEAVRRGFGPLARYIFARERAGPKIAMTAPVLQEPAARGWTVSFIMPADQSLADLPASTGDVRLEEMPGREMAAVRFSGRWTDGKFAQATARLEAWMAGQGLRAASPPEYGYYNDPFTPAFLRRNEVLIEVTR